MRVIIYIDINKEREKGRKIKEIHIMLHYFKVLPQFPHDMHGRGGEIHRCSNLNITLYLHRVPTERCHIMPINC